MATFLPSTKPASFRPCRKGSTIYAKPVAGVLLRNPTTGIADCCPRAASGQLAAAPPRSVMKSRRLRSSMQLPPQGPPPSYARHRLSWLVGLPHLQLADGGLNRLWGRPELF